MIERTSLKNINFILEKNSDWKILDIGCGYTAHEKANYVADVQDFKDFYKNKKKFIKINEKELPFKDKEFDFVIASHVIEHVEDVDLFINELERVASKGYIELPTILEDNLVFENKNDHIWHMEFNDIDNELIISKKIQFLEPLITVSSAKKFLKYFRQSLVLELFWENSIKYKIVKKDFGHDKKISRLTLLRKFFSKLFRNIAR